MSPPGLILLVNQQSPEQAPPRLLQGREIPTRIVVDPQGPHHELQEGPRLLNEEKSLCLLRGFLALETLRDHLLLLILLVVAIPVSPQEGIKSCLLPGDHPGLVRAAPPSLSHCAHYSPHYNRHRQSHVKSPDHPNCFAGNCNSELDDLRFQEWANEASANLPTLNWSLPEWKWIKLVQQGLWVNCDLRQLYHVDVFPTGMHAICDWEHMVSTTHLNTRKYRAIQVSWRLIRDWFTEAELSQYGFRIEVEIRTPPPPYVYIICN